MILYDPDFIQCNLKDFHGFLGPYFNTLENNSRKQKDPSVVNILKYYYCLSNSR